MPENRMIYSWADQQYNNTFKSTIGFTQLLSVKPEYISDELYGNLSKRISLIHDFQDICIDIFRSALKNNDQELLHWLLNETPESFGIEYHKRLDDCHYTKPVFFRTDEMGLGKIVEVQCPGSLWGELQLLYNFYAAGRIDVPETSPAKEFSEQLIQYLCVEPSAYENLDEKPTVHYLLDNASAPAGVRYFIQETTPYIRYWGLDSSIQKADDCQFIRSHSFFGLCGENYFNERVRNLKNGIPGKKNTIHKFKFDFPPYVLFDQKATLALPFWSKTRKFFNDELRNLFVFSSPIINETLELEDGICSIEEFSKRPQSLRGYYLKYAGSDVSINWGSKAVTRLSNIGSEKCLLILKKCIEEGKKGKIWLIQKEYNEKKEVVFWNRNNIQEKNLFNAKTSCFYGPFGLLGIVVSYRKHYKVHGQPETIIGAIFPKKNELDF